MMNYKMQWNDYIHMIREQENKLISQYIENRTFENGLEIGAGDGYQSIFLKTFIKNLIVTEYNEERLTNKQEGVNYMICDAELIDKCFSNESFNIVFSSNLLEHLPNVNSALVGINYIIKHEGLSIHIVPSVFWGVIRLLMFYPNVLLSKLNKHKTRNDKRIKSFDNNLKLDRSVKSKGILNYIFPKPHGVSRNCILEILYFRRQQWKKMFEKSHFEVIKIINGPVTSGYGFGWNKIRNILQFLGFYSENIYILLKK